MDAALGTDDGQIILQQNFDQSNHWAAITSAGRGMASVGTLPQKPFPVI
jgi:hypothetical protein